MIKWERNAFTLPNGKRVFSAKKLLATTEAPYSDQIAKIGRKLTDTDIDSRLNNYSQRYVIPCPDGKEYFPYQKAGIIYLERHKKCLLADDQGLGKTIQAAGLINLLAKKNKNLRILVICPASLKQNWQIELKEWLVRPMTSQVVQGSKHKFCNAQITIVNYEVCNKLKTTIGKDYDIVILDEGHYLMNCTAKRTQAILGEGGIARKAERVVVISGTPVSNRPAELWTLVASVFKKYWPHELRSFRAYGEFFCAGYDEQVRVYDRKTGRTRYVKEFNIRGSSNLEILNNILRERFMLRRLKRDVLPQLPEKQYKVIDISTSQVKGHPIVSMIKKENRFAEDNIRAIETGVRLPPMEEMASVRQELGLLKIPFAKEIIEKILHAEEPVIVFVYHTAVAEALAEELKDYGVSMIIGKTPSRKRQEEVERFQKGITKVFIGNLIAAGTGLTLTASSNVVFVEASWVPGQNEQAVDRAHRISQTKQVNAYFLTWFGSMDAQILRTSINKQRNIDRIMK